MPSRGGLISPGQRFARYLAARIIEGCMIFGGLSQRGSFLFTAVSAISLLAPFGLAQLVLKGTSIMPIVVIGLVLTAISSIVYIPGIAYILGGN